MNVEQVMTLAPVIPVLVIHDVAHARPIAEALVAGGLPALEVTLRTPAALALFAKWLRSRRGRGSGHRRSTRTISREHRRGRAVHRLART